MLTTMIDFDQTRIPNETVHNEIIEKML